MVVNKKFVGCVESRNLSLKLDAGKECLNIFYIYINTYLVLVVHESLSLAVATDYFTYYITYFIDSSLI